MAKHHGLVLITILGASAAAFAAACGDGGGNADHSEGHEGETPAECQAIIDACHAKDTGDPTPVNQCHGFGHAADRDECIRVGNEPTFDGTTCPQVCVDAPLPSN